MPDFQMPPGSVVRATTYFTAPGQIATTTRRWQLTTLTGASTASAQDFVDTYDQNLSLVFAPALSNGANYYGTQVYLENPIGLPPRPATTSANFQPGTGGAGLLPTQCAPVIAFYTATLGKKGQGRIYTPFPPTAAVEANNTLAPAYSLLIGAIANLLSAPMLVAPGPVSATYIPVMYQGGATPAYPIVSAATRDAFGTQRKRGSFGRANAAPNF